MTARFAGRAVLITGSTGIAAAAAKRLGSEGAGVFVVSRTAQHCTDLVAALEAAGIEAGAMVGDLADEGVAQRAVEACVSRFDRLDAAFLVAGGSGRRFGDGPVHEATGDAWDATLALNARSMFLSCRAVVARMLAQEPDARGGRGAVCLMSSVLAFSPSPARFGTHAYAAAKGAAVALGRSMAAMYAPRQVRVNVIAPGLTRTPMAERAALDEDIAAYAVRKQPLVGGFVSADEVAAGAAFLLSDDARAITGQVLVVDGGWSVSESS
jgi:NAD(P)-dependent dehydrogenase (short-subunit alcohol dehydrogenase family)